MHQICYESRQGNFLSKIQRTVDGVVLESNDERDEDCVITFQTESVIEKFLLKFDRLQMDCNDHLYIYDGAHVAGPWRVSQDNINDADFDEETIQINQSVCKMMVFSLQQIFSFLFSQYLVSANNPFCSRLTSLATLSLGQWAAMASSSPGPTL